MSEKIDWERILAVDRFWLNQQADGDLAGIRDLWYRELIHSRYSLPGTTRGSVIFFRSLVREDYRRLFHSVIAASGVLDPVVVEDYISPPDKDYFDLSASRSLIENEGVVRQITARLPAARALLWIRVAAYARILDHFAALPDPRAVVFFADMQPVEHLLALHFRDRGVPTVTLQHGLYVDYGDYETINRVNYLHQPSEYFLSWGPESSALIKRHQPGTRVVECGKPLIFSADPPEGTPAAPRPYVALLLDQKEFHAQNEAMIKIVKNYALKANMDVVVRFHPSLPKAKILNEHPVLKEQLHFSDAALVVGHTTSMIYEALSLGCRVMRYVSKVPAIALPDSAEFTTLAELEAKAALPQPADLWRRYFIAIGDPALKRYRAFFDELLSKPPGHVENGSHIASR